MSVVSGTIPGPLVRPPTETPAIQVSRLSHWFGDGAARTQVLVDLNLEIPPGQVVLLTGPNGAGKTTLLTLLGALRSVQKGSVRVLGRDLTRMDAEEQACFREDVGFIFQGHNLFASLTAFQTVQIALDLKPHLSAEQRRRRASDLLEQLGLGKCLHQKTATLSGGQKQRVAVARALANHPRLILADEPISALDPSSGREVADHLRELATATRCSCLIVTHDLRLADVADRIIHMAGGQITSDERLGRSGGASTLLSRFPGFAALGPEALARVEAQLTPESHPAGTILFWQGDEGNKFYLVRKGVVEAFRREEENVGPSPSLGRRLATLRAGDHFGETALMTGKPRRATVRVREDVDLWSLSKEEFHAGLEGRRVDGL
jgi:putative ABC transport system ATP-binding protein